MRRNLSYLLPVLLLAACGQDSKNDIAKWEGLVINEIAAHDEITDANSWVELLNSGSGSVDLSGVGLYLSDQYFSRKCIYTAPEGTSLAAGERLVLSTEDETLLTGMSSDADFTLKLAASATGKAIDEFTRDAEFTKAHALTARGSYQRIPDGGAQWRALTYSSKAAENAIFSLEGTVRAGVWTWSSHIPSLMADDCAELKSLKAKGYDHIILNYAAFNQSSKKTTIKFLEAAEREGIAVHAWIQCFYNGGWINPIDDENNRYKEEVFERIVSNAQSYIEEYGVKGLHLDYIRFGGTAPKHNPSAEVNAVGAVTRCCRELRELCDSYDEGLVTSAALMPDETPNGYYYGQNIDQMTRYIHIMMPMIYRYSYGYSDEACRNVANRFADNAHGAECWAGTTTYKGTDDGLTPMDAAGILKDCNVYKDSKAAGIVLFRYGLGEFPDIKEYFNQ